jgi:hypothetical protein
MLHALLPEFQYSSRLHTHPPEPLFIQAAQLGVQPA